MHMPRDKRSHTDQQKEGERETLLQYTHAHHCLSADSKHVNIERVDQIILKLH